MNCMLSCNKYYVRKVINRMNDINVFTAATWDHYKSVEIYRIGM